ncbi:hypothetical protein AB6A40_007781 [Gnathostoma spinigerum]|uniref:Ribosome biogenesis protein BRX1 homolog n=1 Tax=Gnathostoma spinigerum TaxID=75299 RepID=A0ABD6EPG9_9BILA
MTKLDLLRGKNDSRNEADDSSSSADEKESKKDEEQNEIKPNKKWKNRERVLIFCSRGALFRTRHLMNDFKRLMPHSRGECKMDKQASLASINEIAEIDNCRKCLYFEQRKHQDTYVWLSNIGEGPSVKFLLHNVHTMSELRLSGNCLKGSRPVLSFDSTFDSQPHLMLIKELFIQTFATPYHHPRSQPFIDHVFSFSVTPDGRIWFRNFQIVNENIELQEIGPRMVLEIIRIFDGSFGGAVLYDNPKYTSPNLIRRMRKLDGQTKYVARKENEKGAAARKAELASFPLPDPVGEVFDTDKGIDEPAAKRVKRLIEKNDKRLRKAKLRTGKKSNG